MVGVVSWLQNNWAAFIGAVCGVAGLWFAGASLRFTGASFREDSKTKRVTTIIALGERYNALWSEVQQRPELRRILKDGIDLLKEPITTEEYVFLRRLVLHFESGWELETILDRGGLERLARDLGTIFRLPLPHCAWDEMKSVQDPRFVTFVERAISGGPQH